MQRALPGIAAALLFLCCSISAAAAADIEYANIHTVGVISAIGDRLSMSKVGFTVFGNSGYDIPIPDWGIDNFVVDKVTEALRPRFTVKAVNADVGPLENQSDTPDVAAFVRNLPASNTVDAYIVVAKFFCEEQCANTPFRLDGLGEVYRRHLIRDIGHLIYAYYAVDVVDARTGKIIDYGTASFGKGLLGLDLPYGDVPSTSWSDTAEGLSPAQKDMIKQKMLPLIERSLTGALTNAKLLP